MSFLRRRNQTQHPVEPPKPPGRHGEKGGKSSEAESPKPTSDVQSSSKAKRPHRKRHSSLVFILGGLFGLIVAGLFARRHDLIEFPELEDLSMDSLLDALPASFVRDVRDLVVCF